MTHDQTDELYLNVTIPPPGSLHKLVHKDSPTSIGHMDLLHYTRTLMDLGWELTSVSVKDQDMNEFPAKVGKALADEVVETMKEEGIEPFLGLDKVGWAKNLLVSRTELEVLGSTVALDREGFVEVSHMGVKRTFTGMSVEWVRP